MEPNDDTLAPPGTYGLVSLLTAFTYVGILWATSAAEEFSYEVAGVVTLAVWVLASGVSPGAFTRHGRRLWAAIAAGIVLGVTFFLALLLYALTQIGS